MINNNNNNNDYSRSDQAWMAGGTELRTKPGEGGTYKMAEPKVSPMRPNASSTVSDAPTFLALTLPCSSISWGLISTKSALEQRVSKGHKQQG